MHTLFNIGRASAIFCYPLLSSSAIQSVSIVDGHVNTEFNQIDNIIPHFVYINADKFTTSGFTSIANYQNS